MQKSIYTISFSHNAQGAHTRHKMFANEMLAFGWELYWVGLAKDDILNNIEHRNLGNFHFIQARFLFLLRVPFLGKVLFSFLNKLLFNIRYRIEVTHHVYFNNYLALGGYLATLKKIFFFCRMDIYLQYVNKKKCNKKRPNRLILFFLSCVQYLTLIISEKYVVQTEPLRVGLQKRTALNKKIGILPNNSYPVVNIKRKPPLSTNQRNIKIGFMANMHWEMKGLDILVDFCKGSKLKPYYFEIAGDGPDLEKLKNSLVQNNVKFLGRVKGAVFLESIDCLLVTTRFDYCPNIILEAISLGVPVIASNIDVHRYMLGCEHPLLFDLNKIEDVHSKLSHLLEFKDHIVEEQFERAEIFNFDWGKEINKILVKEI